MSKETAPQQQNVTKIQKVELEKPIASQSTVETLFAQYQNAFKVVAAQGLDLQRMMRVAVMAVSRSQYLLKCTSISLLGAFMEAAQLGLDLGMKECHLVPYKNKYTHQLEVQLIPDYKGLLKLMRNSGKIKDCWARLVYKGEKFKVIEGDNPHLDHEPNYDLDRSSVNIRCAYTVAVWEDGRHTFEVITRDKIERARKSSASETGPWSTDYDEMALKTAIKHRAKTLPRSEKLAAAVDLDERAELGRPQNIELLGAGDKFMASLGPDSGEDEQPEGSIVLISGTQQGKFLAWMKQYAWSEPQARQMLKKQLGEAIDVSVANMTEVVCQIPDDKFESLIEALEKGPDGKGAPPAKKAAATSEAKKDEAPAAADNSETTISETERDDLWALATDKKVTSELKAFAKTLGYAKLTDIKHKDLKAIYDHVNKLGG